MVWVGMHADLLQDSDRRMEFTEDGASLFELNAWQPELAAWNQTPPPSPRHAAELTTCAQSTGDAAMHRQREESIGTRSPRAYVVTALLLPSYSRTFIRSPHRVLVLI